MHFTKLVLTTMILGSTQISAVPLHWVLQGVTFEDESTAEGSFDYDAESNEYSNIAISTTENEYGDELPSILIGNTIMDTVPNASLSDLTGQPSLSLWFDSPLTDSGGSVPIAILPQSSERTCSSPDCTRTSIFREVTSGSVVAMPNPKGPTAMPNPEGPTAMPNPKGPAAMPNPKGPTAKGPTAMPNPKGPTAMPNPEGPTAMPNPKGPTAMPNPEGPTAMPNPKGPTAMPNPKGPTAMPNPEGPTAMPNPKGPTAMPSMSPINAVPTVPTKRSRGSMTKSSRGSMTKSSKGSMTKSSTSKGKGGKGKSSRSFPL